MITVSVRGIAWYCVVWWMSPLAAAAGGEPLVSDWSHLASQACQLLVQQFGQIGPDTTGEYVSEMVLRRRQAEAELAAAKGTLPRDYREFDRERIVAAMKLDPTYEEAAYTLAHSLVQNQPILPLEAAQEAFRYLERFHEEQLPERLPWGAAPRDSQERQVDSELLAKCDDWLTERGAVGPDDSREPRANPGSD